MSKQETAVKPQKAPLSLDPKYIGRLVGTLTGICLVVALLLGIVNQVTKPRIDAIQKAKQWNAMTEVLQAKVYEPVETSEPCVKALYRATSSDGFVGWVVETATSGSQGIIEMMVGVDPDGKVTGVSVVKHSETPNIGTKVVGDQSVLDRFIGMSGIITLNGGENRFDGVSGATYSSKGVAAGVNAALSVVSMFMDSY